MLLRAVILVVAAALTCAGRTGAQHLWWETGKHPDATCVYGEITVLATHPAVYYCGANWQPGKPAGGYCGIQHNSSKERRTIFSVWDTSEKLHPKVTHADPATRFNRFGGEGEGAHTHLAVGWEAGETFQFLVRKQPGPAAGTTTAGYFYFDRAAGKWRHGATIESPNGDKESAASVAAVGGGGGGLASFLENFGGKDRDVPKIALYRLWLGTDAESLSCLTRAKGDGTRGRLGDAYFLAEGGRDELAACFGKLKERYGEPVFGRDGKELDPITDKPLSAELKRELKNLP